MIILFVSSLLPLSSVKLSSSIMLFSRWIFFLPTYKSLLQISLTTLPLSNTFSVLLLLILPFETFPARPFLKVFSLFFRSTVLNRLKVFSLLSTPHFARLSRKEVETFRSWFDRGGVKWGVDAKHRQHLLPGYLEESESGTWEQAFNHLLDHLIFLPKEPHAWDLPYLDFSDAELLGKGISLIRDLREDLDFIADAHLSLPDWAEHLHSLFERYFTVPKDEMSTYQRFEKKLQMLRELGRINSKKFAFSNIKRYLNSLIKEKKGVRQSKQLEAITFSSLKLGSLLSSKVIALLGMNESSFPRPSIRSSFSLLNGKSDFYPLPHDEDSYLFLEALLLAGKTLLISYKNIDEEDGRDQPPSPFVRALDLSVESHPPFSLSSPLFYAKKTLSQTLL